MSTHFYWAVIGILAMWRVTRLLCGEDGPWNLFVRQVKDFGDVCWIAFAA